jgi:[ribosomal protein S5]-alanine N-acetyltransferase
MATRLITIAPTPSEAELACALTELGQSVCEATRALYKKTGFVPPWLGYLALDGKKVVGTCAFKSPAKETKGRVRRDVRVEIAYFTFPDFEGRGYAKAMAAELVKVAFTFEPDMVIFARTLPQENASTSVLKHNGFRFAGAVDDPDDGLVWQWELKQA